MGVFAHFSPKFRARERNVYHFWGNHGLMQSYPERAEGNYSAYSPDLPGCIATGKTSQEAIANMREAVQLQVDGLLEDNLPIPEPQATAEYISVHGRQACRDI